MSKAYFIIGTDTACGKTLVAGAIAAYLRQAGRDVCVMKPFESACNDSHFLKEISGTNEALELINPYHYDEALAPAVAAERSGQAADLQRVVQLFHELKGRHDYLIAEGAGGLLVPLVGSQTHIELLKQLDVPVLLVARLGLGTINHTLLTLAALKQNALPCAGVLLNEQTPKNSIAEQTNPDVLQQYFDVPILGIFPHLTAPIDRTQLADALPAGLRRLF